MPNKLNQVYKPTRCIISGMHLFMTWQIFKWQIIIFDEKSQISCNNLKKCLFDMFSMYLHVLGLKLGLVTEYKLPFRLAFELFIILSHKLYLIQDYNFGVYLCVFQLQDILRQVAAIQIVLTRSNTLPVFLPASLSGNKLDEAQYTFICSSGTDILAASCKIWIMILSPSVFISCALVGVGIPNCHKYDLSYLLG